MKNIINTIIGRFLIYGAIKLIFNHTMKLIEVIVK